MILKYHSCFCLPKHKVVVVVVPAAAQETHSGLQITLTHVFSL